MNWKIATPDFFNRNPAEVARDLLGSKLVRRWRDGDIEGRIVETEAYLAQNDPASHAYIGIRPRNRWMFGAPGTLYVYTIHRRFCLNAVTEETGIGSAVLIRAFEPLNQIEALQTNRNRDILTDLTTGPGKICEALQINLSHNGVSLCERQELWIELPTSTSIKPEEKVVSTPRIGISKAKELPLRFILKGNSYLSRKK